MRDIAHKAVARRIYLLQIFRHAVKRGGKLRHLIVALHRHAGGKISIAKLLRRVGDAAQWCCHMRGEHNGKHAGYQQHQPGGKNEHGKQVRNVLIQPPRVRGRKGIAAGPVLSNGLAGYIMARAEQPVQCAKLSIGAALRGTGQHAG